MEAENGFRMLESFEMSNSSHNVKISFKKFCYHYFFIIVIVIVVVGILILIIVNVRLKMQGSIKHQV